MVKLLKYFGYKSGCPSLPHKTVQMPKRGHSCRFIEYEAEDEDPQSSDGDDNDCATKEDEEFIDNDQMEDACPHPRELVKTMVRTS